MQMSVEKLPDAVTRVVLSGQLDIAGAAQVELPFSTVTAKNERVVIDVAEVDYVASIGLRLLVGAARTVSRRGGKLVLCNVSPSVSRVLEISGLVALLPSFPTLREAVAAVTADAPA